MHYLPCSHVRLLYVLYFYLLNYLLLCCLWHHRPKHHKHSSHLGSVSMAPFSVGSSHTYHLAPFVLTMITTSLLCTLSLVVFPKTLFSALYSSSCTLPLSVLWSLPFPLTTNPPSLCRWYSAFLVPPTQLWYKHFSPSKRSSTDLFLNDC